MENADAHSSHTVIRSDASAVSFETPAKLPAGTWGVYGAGASGRSAARYLLGLGRDLLLVDDEPARLDDAATGELAEVETVPAREDLVGRADHWVVSPGVPPRRPLASAILSAGKAWADIDLWHADRRVATTAVTGTNGKSSVTRLIATMFEQQGLRVLEGGNIGLPVTELVGRPADRAVIEVSSFQLFYARHFRAEVAVLTNLAPDHLDWHADEAEYGAAKRRLFGRLGPERLAVLPEAPFFDPWPDERALVVRFGKTGRADVRRTDHELRLDWGRRTATMPIPDAFLAPFQRDNLAAAAAAASVGGASIGAIERAAYNWTPLDHRLTTVRTLGDVRFVDDSKATNLHAMVAALNAFEAGTVQLLAGGKRKGLDWSSVLGDVRRQVAAVQAFGECRDEIGEGWGHAVPVRRHDDLDGALRAAASEALPGQTVLLAPGTSSFDQFASYRERGAAFQALVQELASTTGGAS